MQDHTSGTLNNIRNPRTLQWNQIKQQKFGNIPASILFIFAD